MRSVCLLVITLALFTSVGLAGPSPGNPLDPANCFQAADAGWSGTSGTGEVIRLEQPGAAPLRDVYGACCITGGGCEIRLQQACDGEFWEGATCDAVACPNWGACCASVLPGCFVDSPVHCATEMLGWWMPGTCSPDPCGNPVACCRGEACSIIPEGPCLYLEGQTAEATTCSPNPCSSPVESTSWGQIKHRYR